MRWSRASHFSHVSASPPGWLGSWPPRQVRSFNGGWHGLAGWGCFRRLPETSAGLWSDDGANPLSDAGSPVAAADLRLAELRSVSEIPGAAGLSRLLAGKARGAAVLGDGRAFAADQAGRVAGGERGLPSALGHAEAEARGRLRHICPAISDFCASLSRSTRNGRARKWPSKRQHRVRLHSLR